MDSKELNDYLNDWALQLEETVTEALNTEYGKKFCWEKMESLECMDTEGNPAIADISAMSPESCIMQEDEKRRKLHVWISDGEDRLVFDKANPKATLKLLGVCLNR